MHPYNALRHPYRGLRKRMGRAAAIAVLVLGVAAPAALAYYVLNYSGITGSGVQSNAATGGVNGTTAAVDASVYWGAGYTGAVGNCGSPLPQDLAPGSTSKLCLVLQNVAPTVVTVSSLTPTVTTSNPSCLPAWFTVNLGTMFGGPLPITLAPGAKQDNGGSGSITFTSLPTTDQSSCEPPTTVTVSITGNAS